jgi:hypothetical protein
MWSPLFMLRLRPAGYAQHERETNHRQQGRSP